MPTLLVFTPCEKVIISKDDNNPTLIALLSQLRGNYDPFPGREQEPHAKGLAAFRWQVFVHWRREEGDENRRFEQRLLWFAPDGETISDDVKEFGFAPGGLGHRMMFQFNGIPVGQTGDFPFHLFVREKGHEWPEKPVVIFPLRIEMVPAKTSGLEGTAPKS